MTQLAILADDLTGAADTGAAFAARAVTLIAFTPHALPADVLILSTESRHLPRDQAVARVRAATAHVTHATWIYKKIDSTLRGDPAGELAALMDALGETRALIAPAFPAQRRITRDARQYVDGVPLEQSSFAREITTSDVRALFASVAPTTALALDEVRAGTAAIGARFRGARLVVADAETDADLARLAQAALEARVRVWCGSAGLAHALAQHLTLASTAPTPRVPSALRGVTLAVIGSQHPRTRAQVELARARGIAIVQPDTRILSASDSNGFDALALDRDTILTTCGLDHLPIEGEIIAARLARLVRRIVARGGIGKLVLSGGDIAAAVCRTLEADALWLRGEVEPGVPYGILLGGPGAGMRVVTKAGGFGDAETVWRQMSE
jgi:uncharacterized protein YgbK (DUF1537 family)